MDVREFGFETFAFGSVENGAPADSRPCVVISHGFDPEWAAEFLGANDLRWIIVASSNPLDGTYLKRIRANLECEGQSARVVAMSWGLGRLDTGGLPEVPRSVTATWEFRCIRRFIEATKRQTSGPPPWKLLNPPEVPWNVLAAYLCKLGGVSSLPLDVSKGLDVRKELDPEFKRFGGEGSPEVLANLKAVLELPVTPSNSGAIRGVIGV